MSKKNLRQWLKDPRHKLAVALGGLLLSWIYLFFYLSGSGTLFQYSNNLEQLKLDCKASEQEFQNLSAQLEQLKMVEADYYRNVRSCWNQSLDGEVETVLRQLTEAASQKSGIQLNSLGTVRVSRINQELSYGELEMSANAPLEQLSNFFSALMENPHLGWKRVDLRAGRPGDASGNLAFSGTLRVIVFDGTLPEKWQKESAANSAGGGK